MQLFLNNCEGKFANGAAYGAFASIISNAVSRAVPSDGQLTLEQQAKELERIRVRLELNVFHGCCRKMRDITTATAIENREVS